MRDTPDDLREKTMMKITILAVLAILLSQFTASVHADDAGVNKETTAIEKAALAVVAKRIDGYNNHDVDAYLAAHDEDLEIYEYPDKSIGRGRSHLENIFGPMLEQGIGEIIVQHQAAVGNTVVSEEYVGFGGPELQHIVAIYTVEDGLITAVRLVESD